jgi:2-polyprenyl-3-methyl-5-hydroxy-6-metoxy-1,4-benzoquinol methylase
MNTINKYGDTLIKTTGQHGADISSQRIDELDKENIKYVLDGNNFEGLDVGCGFGFHSIRLNLLNVKMHLIDILDISEHFDKLNNTIRFNFPLDYKKLDINQIKQEDISNDLDFIYSQRFIHYLTFEKALSFLKVVSAKMKPLGKVFISASGINSELSDNYTHKNKNIRERFCKLSSFMGNKHNILEPVCLYSKEDISELLNLADFKPIKIWESDFGNIKAIAEKNKCTYSMALLECIADDSYGQQSKKIIKGEIVNAGTCGVLDKSGCPIKLAIEHDKFQILP